MISAGLPNHGTVTSDKRTPIRTGVTRGLGPPRATAAWRPTLATMPGLLVVAVATVLAFALGGLVPGIGPATVAIVLGVLAVNVGLHRRMLQPGTTYAAKQLLRASIVLLGLQLALPQLLELGGRGLMVVVVTVAVTFFGTQLLGRLMGVSPARSLLVATGFSICGASAVAAMKEVSDGDEDDAAVAIALVTLCGSLAILILPALQGPLGLDDPVVFGSWIGASVHDVGQTVATASQVDGALTSAVVVKLSRVVLLAPLVAGVAVVLSRRGTRTTSGKRPPIVPLFVAGFLGAIVITSTGVLPEPALDAARTIQKVLLVAALFGLGTGIRLAMLRRTGGRAVLLGSMSWLLVALVSYTGVRWFVA